MAVPIRLVAIGLIAGLLAACTSGDAQPTSSPTPTTGVRPVTTYTESPTSSRTGPLTTGPNIRPGETPPEYPALARQHTPNGALAFAGYYFKAFDWGYATNDPYLVEQISGPHCRACARYVRGLRGLANRNAILRGGRVTFDAASVFHGVLDIRADFAVDVAIDEQPIVLDEPGAPIRTLAPAVKDFHSLVFVAWRDGNWRVVEVTNK